MDFGRVCNLLLISGPSRYYIRRITSHTFHLTCYLSHVTSHALPLSHYLSHVTSHLLPLTRYISHVTSLTRYISHVTSLALPLTRYLSRVTSHALYLTLPLQVYNNVKMFLAAGGVEVLCYVAVSDSSLTGELSFY